MAEYIDREAALKAIAEDKIEMTPELIAISRAIGTYTAEQAFDGINQACDRHIESIKILPAVDVQLARWIPVTERLPEENGFYLCLYKAKHPGGVAMDEGLSILQYLDNKWHLNEIYTVTHWMPLPEPPERANDESN